MLELISIVVLILVFAAATVLPINMGVLALTAALLLGLASGLTGEEIVGAFPSDILILIVGITLLFGIAHVNGTMDLFIQASLRLVGERRWAVPWLIFVVAGILMSFGFVLAVSVIAPAAMSMARRFQISPLLMAMMLSHGALAASLSPVTVYANFTREIAGGADIAVGSVQLFAAGLVLNLLFALVLYAVLGRGLRQPIPEEAATDGDLSILTGERLRLTWIRAATLAGIVALVVGAFLEINVGATALLVATVLLLLAPRAHTAAHDEIGWGVVLLVGGMLTLMAVLTANGTIQAVADAAAALGSPLLAALMILFVVGILSAFGSSIGTVGVALPLAFPLVADGGVAGAGLVVSIAVISLIVDVSPFSTNGAVVLSQAKVPDRQVFQRRMLAYTGLVTVVAPVLAWLAIVIPPSL
ncbi:hypothetical protein JL108_00860 [Aeromicrobium sp. YIM 150415]|uniref:SLC13 family permease n=1 Tax=Aeromicrobium sp. YIM 150415 TaxID=2803912 RepID=UPI001966CD73|nr:SLC13 family permease [Aeromicrobium sp. YIM 150415]MBM9461975.1 hypothetical protein [Aeromicrobium sp. YIM 150415]